MEAPGVTIVTLLCVLFSIHGENTVKISGAIEEMRVRRGDNVTLYCDCVYENGFKAVWFRNCSHHNQPQLTIWLQSDIPRYSFSFNNSSRSFDLLIKNVGESDLGLYYCGLHEKETGSAHRYGNRLTRLSLLEENSTFVTMSPNSTTPHEPGRSCSWQLLVSVSAVCVLLSSLFSSIGVYYLCRKNLKAEVRADRGGSDKRAKLRSDEVGEGGVCYSTLDFQKIKKKKQKQRVQHSDFSTYSEVRTQRT